MKRFKTQQIYVAFIMLILSVFLITGCGGGGGGGGETDKWLGSEGTTAPTVTATDPVNIDTDVCINKEITATFSKAMTAGTITATGTFTVRDKTAATDVVGIVTYAAATRTATFTPTAALIPTHHYTATIKGGATGVKDSEGNAMAADKVWSFTVGTGTCAPVIGTLLSTFGIASYGGVTDTGATKLNGNAVLDPNHFCNAAAVGSGNDFGANCNSGANKITNNTGDLVITQTYPDTTTADAVMVALLAKWNSITMAGLPGGTLLGCGTIGSGGDAGAGIGCNGNYTLPPGIYISSTHSTIDITGDLILDGQGDPNAVFVFQVPSAALTATPGSPSVHTRILLINSAKASNVWWEVGSSATLGDYTEFQGNVLASASITMNTGATSCGRLLAGAEGSGAFTFLGNTVSVPGHPNAPAGCE